MKRAVEARLEEMAAGSERVLRRIGDVAAALGVSLRTLRHYEDAGLITPTQRTVGGFRLYDEDAVERLRLVVQMKPFGFSLDEMRLFLETRARLANPLLPERERQELEGRLAMFSSAAAERLAQLREQLSVAESFSEQLHTEANRLTGHPLPPRTAP